MDEEASARFGEFVAGRMAALMRVAYLLTGDQHRAEDLVQSALAKTLRRWSSVRHQDPEGYVRAVMYREQVSWWRRRGRQPETLTGTLTGTQIERPTADPAEHVGLRVAMRHALLRLPPAQRAILVLRYYEDLPEARVAEVLNCSVGTVRSRTHRAVSQLRRLLSTADIVRETTP